MNFFIKEIYDGATDSEDPYVFKVWDLWLDQTMFPKLESPDLQVFEQENYTESRQACTIVNAIRDWWHRFGIKFTDFQIIEIIQYIADNYWYKIGTGWDTNYAMNCLAKYFNKFYPQHPCYYARIDVNDPMFVYALSHNHSIGFTYKGNSVWNTDRADGELSWKSYSPITYWHRSCLIMKNGISVDDSYPIKQYTIKYFKDLIMGQWGTNIYGWFYVWIADDKQVTEQLKKYYKWKVWLESNIHTNTLMINDTIDSAFKKASILENKRLQEKLNFISNQILILDK